MLKAKPEKRCKICGNSFRANLSVDQFCSYSCALEHNKRRSDGKTARNKPIRQRSAKQSKLVKEYMKLRNEILGRGYRCAVYPDKKATEIHHKMKRRGFADRWAELNNVPLIVDVRHFLPVSREGHEWIENNPEEAYRKGFSIRNNGKRKDFIAD